MYAVMGSTGQVGGAVVRSLRAKGCEVRALLRNEDKKAALESLGAEPFITDIADGGQLENALQNVEGLFLMVPPLIDAPDPRSASQKIVAAAVDAIKAAGVPRVVLLSCIGAQIAEGTGVTLKSHDLEEALLSLGRPVASIRAATFMDNIRVMLPHIRETGKWLTPFDRLDQPMKLISVNDISKVAAQLLTEPWDTERIIELEGPRSYSILESAAILSKALSQPVKADTIPKAQRIPMFQQFGMTPAAAADMVEMEEAFDSGLIVFESGEDIESIRGETTFEHWLEDTLRTS